MKLLLTASYGDVCIALARGDATREVVAGLRSALHGLARKRRSGIGLLFVIAESSSAPNAAVRELASEMFTSLASSLKVMSVVLEGAGFAAAAKRSVFTFATSRLLGKIPTKTFGDLGQGSDYLATKAADVGVSCPTSMALTTFVRSVHKPVAR